MATFGITPVGTFPPPTADNFPDFLQWQSNGANVGTTAVETVNVTGGASVSVNAGGDTVTIDVMGSAIEVSQDGVLVSNDITRLDFSTGLVVSPQSAGVARVETTSTFTWREVTADYTVVAADANNGLNCNIAGELPANVTIPANVLPVNSRITLCQFSALGTNVVAGVGVTIHWPAPNNGVFAAQYSIMYLDQISLNTWVMSGEIA